MGLGAAEAIHSSARAEVIARFDRAAYLRFPGGVIAVTGPGVPLGPLHLAGGCAPLESGPVLPSLRPGDTLLVPEEWLAGPTIWRGELPPPGAVDDRLLTSLAPLAEKSALLAEPLFDRWQAAIRQGPGDLASVSRLLGGLGPGLTPSGDDALAGILLAARLRWPGSESCLVALAGDVDTHEISRAFLAWAARGQSIEPVHRLLAGDAGAGAELLAFGHTSGADLALGLQWGLTRTT